MTFDENEQIASRQNWAAFLFFAVLCGPLRPLRLRALLNAEDAKGRKGPQRRIN